MSLSELLSRSHFTALWRVLFPFKRKNVAIGLGRESISIIEERTGCGFPGEQFSRAGFDLPDNASENFELQLHRKPLQKLQEREGIVAQEQLSRELTDGHRIQQILLFALQILV